MQLREYGALLKSERFRGQLHSLSSLRLGIPPKRGHTNGERVSRLDREGSLAAASVTSDRGNIPAVPGTQSSPQYLPDPTSHHQLRHS